MDKHIENHLLSDPNFGEKLETLETQGDFDAFLARENFVVEDPKTLFERLKAHLRKHD